MSRSARGCCEGSPAVPRDKRPKPRAALFGSGFSLAAGLAVLLAPKCPLCLAAYLSLLGMGVSGAGAVAPFLLPAGAVLLALGLGSAAYHVLRAVFPESRFPAGKD